MQDATSVLIHVHSVPKGQRARLEWEVARVLGRPVAIRWRSQPVIIDTLCGSCESAAAAGSAALVASALFGWRDVRFDIYEAASSGNDGVRFSYTPRLGLFRAQIDAAGSTVIPEERLRLVVESAGLDARALRSAIDDLLGLGWDEELEPLREINLGLTQAS